MAQQTATFPMTLTVKATVVPIILTFLGLPGATQGQPYVFQLTAGGGTPPYSWTTSGLPLGLFCSASGLISGTPTASGAFPVTVIVSDSGV